MQNLDEEEFIEAWKNLCFEVKKERDKYCSYILEKLNKIIKYFIAQSKML